MGNFVPDELKRLAFISFRDQSFFSYSVQDDYALDYSILNSPELKERFREVDLRLLESLGVDAFVKKYNKYIKTFEELYNDFYEFYENKASYWNVYDYGLIPSVLIDFDEKKIFQFDIEFILPYAKYIPQDWKGEIMVSFADAEETGFFDKYRDLFYWVKDDVDLLEALFKNKESWLDDYVDGINDQWL